MEISEQEAMINLTLADGDDVSIFRHKIVGWYKTSTGMYVILVGGVLKVKETSEQIKNLMSNKAQGTNNKGDVIHG